MYNLRYHIASLVAVFLALAVGLLLGTIVVERGALNAQRTALVDSIKSDVNNVTKQNQSLKASNDALNAYAAAVTPQVLADRLTARTIVIVADPDSGETVTRVQDILRSAGASPAVMTLSAAGLGLDDPKVSDAATRVLGPAAASELETRVVETLAREWTTAGDPRLLTSALVAAGGLKVQGLAPGDAASGVVVTAAFGGAPDPDGTKLAKAMTGQGRFGAGVETTKKRDGQAKAAVDAGMSGVDDVDTPLGSVSLVWVLTGRASGSFGTGAGVDGQFPNPLFPTQ